MTSTHSESDCSVPQIEQCLARNPPRDDILIIVSCWPDSHEWIDLARARHYALHLLRGLNEVTTPFKDIIGPLLSALLGDISVTDLRSKASNSVLSSLSEIVSTTAYMPPEPSEKERWIEIISFLVPNHPISVDNDRKLNVALKEIKQQLEDVVESNSTVLSSISQRVEEEKRGRENLRVVVSNTIQEIERNRKHIMEANNEIIKIETSGDHETTKNFEKQLEELSMRFDEKVQTNERLWRRQADEQNAKLARVVSESGEESAALRAVAQDALGAIDVLRDRCDKQAAKMSKLSEVVLTLKRENAEWSREHKTLERKYDNLQKTVDEIKRSIETNQRKNSNSSLVNDQDVNPVENGASTSENDVVPEDDVFHARDNNRKLSALSTISTPQLNNVRRSLDLKKNPKEERGRKTYKPIGDRIAPRRSKSSSTRDNKQASMTTRDTIV